MLKLCKSCGGRVKIGEACAPCDERRAKKSIESMRKRRRPKREKDERKFYKSRLWQVARAKVLLREPFCRTCKEPAVDVDHIDSNRMNISDDNLQPLCKSCHSKKTFRECRENPRYK